ncbi:MAG: 2-oxoacid:ferredoxin oxidoreductase subunit beta [Chloroflexi bacterium]|nr:2-oxoacid:ferredoxin oxidoreductase subunit beta [Chloroflexota bacterium]
MADGTLTIERTIDDYKSEEKPTWCPGCGDFGVLNAVYNALRIKGYDSKDVVAVAGIGCSSRFPFFVSSYGFHGVHGRAMPIATGVKVANPDLAVLALGGDGDGFAIGGGHFIHAARRNLDITYIIMDNAVYGLTKGQTSPTSMLGYVSKSTPKGSLDQALNPLTLAIACGATFVARAFSGKPKELADLIVQGIEHKGFSLIDAYSPCPTFNKINTFKFYRDEVADLPAGYDPSDMVSALHYAAIDDPLYTGLIYQRASGSTSYNERLASQHSGVEADAHKVIGNLFARFS